MKSTYSPPTPRRGFSRSLLCMPALVWLLGIGATSALLPLTPVLSVPAVAKTTINKATRLEVNLTRRKLTVYEGTIPVKTYRVGIGKPGWETPVGEFKVAQMMRDPTWISPFTKEVIPASSPKNPLNGYWIGFWTDGNNWVGFHGTLNPKTVGQAASHGCLHMYREDLADLFNRVGMGTTVSVVP